MRGFIFFITVLYFSATALWAQTASTVGPGGDYTTLKGAFDAINSGTLTGIINLQIIGNTTETASAVLNETGTGSASYDAIVIYPTGSGYIISGSISSALVKLNGADYVTIDGRVNRSCGEPDLTFKNTGTGTVFTLSGADKNKIQFCDIQGAGTANILFDNLTSGSDTNLIAYNYIHESTSEPTMAIKGESPYNYNYKNTFIGNYIYNFWSPSNSSYGVYLTGGNHNWTFLNNHFYQTTTRTASSNSITQYGLYCSGVLNGINFKGNYIGGSTDSCGGGPWTVNGSYTQSMKAIYGSVTANSGTVQITNNVIKNINYTTSFNSYYLFVGISLDLYSGQATINDNIIGDSTGTGSISLTTSGSGYTSSYGIYVYCRDTVYIEDNIVGSITADGTTATSSHTLHGIQPTSSSGFPTMYYVRRNIIGSKTTSNSLNASKASTSSSYYQHMYGILYNTINSTDDGEISNNIIANLNNAYVGTASYPTTAGIRTKAGRINNNEIFNISSAAPYNVWGIYLYNSYVSSASGNVVHDISSTYSGASIVYVYGIDANRTLTTKEGDLTNNLIYNLSLSSTSSSSRVFGLYVNRFANASNNIISLGNGFSGNKEMYGMWVYSNSFETSILYNTIYLSGTVASSTNHTYAYYEQTNTDSTLIKNNIFFNARSNSSGTAKHYAIRLPGTTNLEIDYNSYYISGTGGILGYLAGDQTTLGAWQTATGQDANSVNSDPSFYSAGGDEAIDYIQSALLLGVSGTGVSEDYFYQPRSVTPLIGAVEGPFWTGTTSTAFGTDGNWLTSAPTGGSNIVFHPSPSNSCLLNLDFQADNIVINQATYLLDIQAQRLSISGELKFTNGAQIDANGNSGVITLNGGDIQYIDPSHFVDGEIDNLEINNAAGVILLGDITINQSLRLTQGILQTGPHKIILKDDAVISGTPNSSNYVNGTIQKIGNDAFTFAIGNDDYYAPISISAPSNVTDVFTAYYDHNNPINITTNTCVGSGLDHVSSCEHWELERTNGTSSVSVTLGWDDRSCGVTEINDITVVHWNGSEWEDVGQAGLTGNTTSGTVTSDPVSNFSPFTLGSVSKSNPLPVELSSFEAMCDGSSVLLHWATEVEINNDYFQLERSMNGFQWETVYSVDGEGNKNTKSTYHFLDKNQEREAYYRIKQVDYDGKISYSNIIHSSCANENSQYDVKVYPNPMKNELTILSNPSGVNKTFYIENAMGQRLLQGKIQNTQTSINIQPLSSGIYYFKIEQDSTLYKLIKN